MKRSFEKFCKDYKNIENYEKAAANNFKGWCCHHRLETHTSDGERRLVYITVAELQALGMYYGRPASELIFMKKSEHSSLHKPSDDTKMKMSEAHKGEKNPMYGKHLSEETKNKLSEEHKKKLSEAKKGYQRSDEAINKTAESNRGRHWYNNGKENKYCYECPPGFVIGMLKIK